MYKVQNSVEGHLSNVILRPKLITYHLKASDLMKNNGGLTLFLVFLSFAEHMNV